MKKVNKKLFYSLLLSVISLHAFGQAEKTSALTAPMKECDVKDIKACFQDRSKANHAFRIVRRDDTGNPIKTKYSALLIHGLSDSPYFYRDIAQILFKRGINVIAIRNSGHGTLQKHLRITNRSEWYSDMSFGMSEAEKLGENILVAGMSLGGALAVREAQINPKVKGLMLFSPAIKMPSKMSISCPISTPGIRVPLKAIGFLFTDVSTYQARKEYGVDVRYQGIHNRATCQLKIINDEIIERGGFEKINIPVFNVVSEYDGAVDKDFIINFSSQVGSNAQGKSHLVLYQDPSQEFSWNLPQVTTTRQVDCMPHASVLLRPSGNRNYQAGKCSFTSKEIKSFNTEKTYDFTPEVNLHFDLVKNSLERFIDQAFN